MSAIHTDILILGGGSGGMDLFGFLSKQLKRLGSNKTITLIDTKDHYVFVPLLHEVGAGTITGEEASVKYKKIIQTPHTFVQTTIRHIDPKAKKVSTDNGIFSYDYCIVGTGSQTNYFNTPGAETYTHNVRTRSAAEALVTALHEKRANKEPFSINIIGGGYTGVEIASEIAYKYRTCPHTHVTLVHAQDTLLPTMPKPLVIKATKRLKKIGVNILLNGRAIEVTKEKVIMNDGTQLPNDITVWSTGFMSTGNSLFPPYAKIEKGRVPVNEYLLSEFENLYAIGDISLFIQNENPIPQLAEVAHDQARYIATHIANSIQKKKTKPFVFHSRGSFLPLGNWYGIGVAGPIKMSGPFAWIIRQIVYVIFFPTLRGKIRLLRSWLTH